jgi:hypothetical protein
MNASVVMNLGMPDELLCKLARGYYPLTEELYDVFALNIHPFHLKGGILYRRRHLN